MTNREWLESLNSEELSQFMTIGLYVRPIYKKDVCFCVSIREIASRYTLSHEGLKEWFGQQQEFLVDGEEAQAKGTYVKTIIKDMYISTDVPDSMKVEMYAALKRYAEDEILSEVRAFIVSEKIGSKIPNTDVFRYKIQLLCKKKGESDETH